MFITIKSQFQEGANDKPVHGNKEAIKSESSLTKPGSNTTSYNSKASTTREPDEVDLPIRDDLKKQNAHPDMLSEEEQGKMVAKHEYNRRNAANARKRHKHNIFQVHCGRRSNWKKTL